MRRATSGLAVLLTATMSACGVSGDLTSSPRTFQTAELAEFSILATYRTESDSPADPDLAAHLSDMLGPDAQIRHIADVDHSRVFMARGDTHLCIATEGEFLTATCGEISTPLDTWVAGA